MDNSEEDNSNDDIPNDNSVIQKVLNNLIFQLQAQMRFGNGQGVDFNLQPGIVSQGLYYGSDSSDNDPMGQSYYDQGQGNQSVNPIRYSGNMSPAISILRNSRKYNTSPLSLVR